MKVVKKALIPFSQISTLAECLLQLGLLEKSHDFLSIRKDIISVYGDMSTNYGILLTVYDNDSMSVETICLSDCCL